MEPTLSADVFRCSPIHSRVARAYPCAPDDLPAPHGGDGRNEIGADASFDLHELRIPSNFLDGSEALDFFGAFAFGLRGSLFERFCPLAILHAFNRAVFPRQRRHARDTRVEGGFQTIKQTCPGAPRLGAPFESVADMAVGGR